MHEAIFTSNLLADPSSSNVTIHCERNNCFEIMLKFLTFEIGMEQDCLLTRGEASSDLSMSDVPTVCPSPFANVFRLLSLQHFFFFLFTFCLSNIKIYEWEQKYLKYFLTWKSGPKLGMPWVWPCDCKWVQQRAPRWQEDYWHTRSVKKHWYLLDWKL